MGLSELRIVVLSLFAVGCSKHRGPQKLGACTYERNEPVSISATIVSDEVTEDGRHEVKVEGDRDDVFVLDDEQYARCVTEPGLSIGDPAPVKVREGGPCPPMVHFGECDGR